MQSSLSRRVEGRNLYIYDRRFENSTRREAYLVTRDVDLEGLIRILHKAFEVPDHESFLLVTTERTVLDAEKYSRLQDSATLYMLQRDDQTLEVPTQERIYFTPHHDTVVESGTYKYYDSEGKKSLPYALADLVDNALSATVNNAGVRTIEIRMLFNENCGKPAVIVWDNGCGMTSKQLNNWAVYKLSKFNRENGSDQGNYTHPGYVCRSLNSDISYFGVGGKQAAFYIGKTIRVITKSSSSPDVHELVLSKALFEKKEKNKEDPFSSSIYNRKPGESSHISKPEDCFLHDLIAEECGHQSFTAVVITDVLKEHITFLKEDFELWTRQLAHIYHYYLHGPNGNIQGAVSKSSIPDFELSQIDILITLQTKKSPCVVNLRDIGTDLQSLYIKTAVSTFEFRACTNPEAGMVEGILRYHPFLYDRETYPKDPDTLDVQHGYVEDDVNEYNTDSTAQKQKKPVFECYWNGRLIPYTTVQDFDWCAQAPKGSELPAECYNRISGVLFTDDTFKVTENKLTFIDLEQKLKNKETIFTFVKNGQKQRSNLKREFSQWLQSCHENFDKQVKFMTYEGTITRDDIPTKRNQHPWATFSKMEWGGRIYQAGDYVKSLKTVPIYNGKVNRFLLFGIHQYDEDVYGPGGQVEIGLEPKGLYEKTKIISLSKIDRNATDEEIKKNIKNDSAKLPDKLEVLWPEGNQWPDNTTHPAGTVLGPINVKILNKKGDTISILPSVGRGMTKKMSVVLKLVHHVSKGDEEICSMEAEHSSTWNFWFKGIGNIFKLGKYTLHLITIQSETKANEFGERRLPHFKLRFAIKEDVADQFDMATVSSILRIGVPFDISLEFKDRYGHTVKPHPDLKPTLQCRGLDVAYEQVKCGNNTMSIKNVKATGKLKNHLEPNPYDIKVTVDGLKEHSKTLKITVLPGNPHSIQVFPKENPVKVENGNTIKWGVMVQDEAGNLTATPNMTVRCYVPQHPPANISCIAGAGEYVTKPIYVSLVKGNPQSLLVQFNVPNQRGIKEVTRELLVVPSKRISCIKIYEKDAGFELKNNDKVNWMAGSLLENLYFTLYDEGNREVPITAEVASKIQVNWTGKINRKELMKGKLPDVTVPTKIDAENFYQVLYQDQSVSVSFSFVPLPDEPAGLKAVLPKCTARLGEILPESITLELVDRYENVTKTLTPSCVNEIMVEGEGLDREALTLTFEESNCSVVVTGVRFTSGTPGTREMSFTFGDFTCHARLEVTAGIPAKLALINEQDQFLHVLNGHGISTPFVIQLCDQWGNPSPDRRVVVKILASAELNMNTNVSSQPVNAKGQASFNVTCVTGPKGSYELKFKGFFKKDPIPGPSVKLNVLPDPNKPVSLEVEYDKTATFVAGKLFPVFLVTVMSDEGKPIVNKGAVSMLYWKGELSRNAPPNTAIEFQCCEPKETEKKDIFYFREKPIPEHVGNYTIQFCLRDINNEITLRNDQIVINVVANRPTKLAPEIPPPTQVVSYSEDIAKRMLVDNMTLMIMDQYGNPAGQGLNGDVEICIKNLNGQTRKELPLFEDKTTSCKIKLENGKAHVSKLAIMKKSPGIHGVTYMVLFRPVLSPRVHGDLDSYEFHFSFSNDEENQKKHVALSRKRDTIKEDIIKIKNEDNERKKLMKEYEELLQKLCQKEAALRNQLIKDCNENLPENASIEMVEKILNQRLLEADWTWKARRYCRILNNHKGPGILGKVGHLAHVMNDSEAWVISWHIRGDMDCVVTTTTAAARQIYNLTNGNQQVLPIDGINPSCRRTLPPLPHIRNGRVLFEPKGNPVYAANVLIYPENQKDCEIVFRNLLGSTILIDDLDSASYYRQSAVRCGEMCQTILTRQGERISSKGKFGGAQNKAPPYNKLEMFGAPVPERYISLQRNIDLLQQYRNALEKKLQHIQEQTKTFNHLDVIIKKNRESLGIMDKQLQEIETQLATPLKRVSDSGCDTSGIAAKRAKF